MTDDPVKAKALTLAGGADLVAAFKHLADETKGEALEAATRAAALPILNQVRITVPEGGRTPYKTGTYHRSFHLETIEKTRDRCVVEVGTDAPQGKRLEYGFVGPDKLGRVYNQAARPHVRPAFDENVATAKEEFRAAMEEIIVKGAQKRAG